MLSDRTLKLKYAYSNEEQQTNLREFVDTQDRGPPPIFVGREDILERIQRDVERCREDAAGTGCYTLAIHGAPGAGKTSLIAEIAKRLGGEKQHSGRFGGALVVVRLTGGTLSNKVLVAKRIIEAYNGEPLYVQGQKTTTEPAKAKIVGTGVNYQRTIKDSSLNQQIENAGGLWQSIVDNTNIDKSSTVILLLIDEAQNIQGDSSESEINSIVMALHEGLGSTEGLKIVPIFAGLTTTESALSKAGASRLGNNASIPIGSLSSDETEELVTSWMQYDRFGFETLFEAADIDRVAKMIMVASEGWPRHTNGYLKELGRSILESGSENRLSVDLDEVLDHGHEDRLKYYGTRISRTEINDYAPVICEVAQQSSNGLVDLNTLFTVAEQVYGISRSDARALHKKAIHTGLLEPLSLHDPDWFKFPIPSLYTYMRCGRDPDRFKEEISRQMDAHSHLWT